MDKVCSVPKKKQLQNDPQVGAYPGDSSVMFNMQGVKRERWRVMLQGKVVFTELIKD